MENPLVTAISEIRSNKLLFTSDEASIKSGIVQWLLLLLGWNPFDINEVTPEYTIESKRVDFSLRINGSNKVFIEVKRPTENLEEHQEQLLNYSFREGVKLAILTSGMRWWFYLPLHEGSWEQRRFFAAEFLEQDPTAIASRFIELLAKINVTSGVAIENAERLYKSGQKKIILKETLPKAWNKIINDPDELLVELLIETTEKLSGFRPDESDVQQFLANRVQDTSRIQVTPPKPPPPPPSPRVKRERFTSQDSDYTNKTVQSIDLLGKTYHPGTWKKVIIIVSEEMYRRHAINFDRCLNLRGTKMTYFNLNPNELIEPVNISGSKYFVETKLNANSNVRRSRDLMALFGYKEADLKISAK